MRTYVQGKTRRNGNGKDTVNYFYARPLPLSTMGIFSSSSSLMLMTKLLGVTDALQVGSLVSSLCAQSPSIERTLLHPSQATPEVDKILHASTETPTSKFHSRKARPTIDVRMASKEGGGLEVGWNSMRAWGG
jgi:hypothetical protein